MERGVGSGINNAGKCKSSHFDKATFLKLIVYLFREECRIRDNRWINSVKFVVLF